MLTLKVKKLYAHLGPTGMINMYVYFFYHTISSEKNA